MFTQVQVQDPTPDQIEERCQEIQKSWTPAERRARLGGVREPSRVTRVQSTGVQISDNEMAQQLQGWEFLEAHEERRNLDSFNARHTISSENLEEEQAPEEPEEVVQNIITQVVNFGE